MLRELFELLKTANFLLQLLDVKQLVDRTVVTVISVQPFDDPVRIRDKDTEPLLLARAEWKRRLISL